MDRWRHQHLAVNRHFVHCRCNSWVCFGYFYFNNWLRLIRFNWRIRWLGIGNGSYVFLGLTEWLLTIGARCRIFSWGCYLGRWSRRIIRAISANHWNWNWNSGIWGKQPSTYSFCTRLDISEVPANDSGLFAREFVFYGLLELITWVVCTTFYYQGWDAPYCLAIPC